MRLAAIIPSLNPDARLVEVTKGLIEAGFGRIYLVDDGSAPEYEHIFSEASNFPEVVFIRHDKNCGKGRALKTAMKLYLEQDAGEYIGVVTVDGDGQHSARDSAAVARALEENPKALILGVRDFDADSVPPRSAFGNKLTRNIMRAAFGIKISDTQTGLRAISNGLSRALLDVQGERYEFETNMLLQVSRLRIPIAEVPIGTIYIDSNSGSHYRALLDSLRILALILKFAFASIGSAGLDYLLFWLLDGYWLAAVTAEKRLFIAVAAARVVSALFNFTLNKTLVFKNRGGAGGAVLRYGILAAGIMLCSYGGIYLLSEIFSLPSMLAKLLTDMILFIASFHIQRRWVFQD